ncbi:MAG: hypothetical protein U0931_37110 [Vulcanimicrobiota bacterium]
MKFANSGGRSFGPKAEPSDHIDEVFQENWPVTVATTWLDRDPAGALARFVQRGGKPDSLPPVGTLND